MEPIQCQGCRLLSDSLLKRVAFELLQPPDAHQVSDDSRLFVSEGRESRIVDSLCSCLWEKKKPALHQEDGFHVPNRK